MQVVIVEPQQKPTVQEIGDSLESMQKIVGGLIEAVYPFDEPVALICNQESEVLDRPLNPALRESEGTDYDTISGTFFLCAGPPDSEHFESLTDQQVKTYLECFATPEMFLNVGDDLFVLPYL